MGTKSTDLKKYQEKIKYLENKCKQLEEEKAELNEKVKWFMEHFRLSQHKQYGTSSEKISPGQMQLFDEAEVEAQPLLVEPTLEKITYQRRKKKGYREAQLKNLPEERIEYRLPEEEQVCFCGHKLHEMSTEERQELKIVPARVSVLKHVRYVYSCRRCEKNETDIPIVETAKMPNPVLKGSLVSPSVLAYVMTQKYLNSMPLYRQEQQFKYERIELSRQNLANWVVHGANKWLAPLYDRMHFHLLREEVAQSDETPLQVLREPGRPAERTSYMWLYRTGWKATTPIVLFDYQETRSRDHPLKFLKGFTGYLQVDGYDGYNNIPGVKLVGCWAHARRMFDKALKALPPPKKSADVAARKGLKFCNQLFAIERDLTEMSAEDRYRERLVRSRPVLDAFLAWLKEQESQVLPKSALGKAINYCLNQWPKLEAFMLDGRLDIDNNRSERSIKPFVIGRKNWIFSNTPKGARASAITYSIVETAKENGLNSFYYLQYLFEKLPNIDIEDPDALDQLLPWSDSLPESCKMEN